MECKGGGGAIPKRYKGMSLPNSWFDRFSAPTTIHAFDVVKKWRHIWTELKVDPEAWIWTDLVARG